MNRIFRRKMGKFKLMYRIYWADNYERMIDFIDVSTLFTANKFFINY